jgi:hypothetical protein
MFWMGATAELRSGGGNLTGRSRTSAELIVRLTESFTFGGRDRNGRMLFNPVERNTPQANNINATAGFAELIRRDPRAAAAVILISGTAAAPGMGELMLEGLMNRGWTNLMNFNSSDKGDGTKVAPGTQAATSNLDPNDPCFQWQKKANSLRQRAREHVEKLDDYRADPFKFDNQGYLARNPDPLIQQKIINSRIRHLQQEIDNWNNQADALEEKCK